MSRVPWTTYDGADVERVIAVMLCSESPSLTAVRPGRGDGGLDVIVPTGDGQHAVYQVKKFAENLTTNQKTQIEESFKRVLVSAEAGHVEISDWYLTLPLDPTPGNRTWFAEMTADAPFNCEWRGLAFCERLVTDHQDVVDYYLRDGKDRLAAAMSDALAIVAGRDRPESNGLLPAQEFGDALSASARLVDTDPHYRFGFRLLPHQPTHADGPAGAIYTQAQWESEVGMWLCVDVYARFEQALALDPISFDVRVNLDDPDSQLARDLADFAKYGRPFSAPLGTADIEAHLPGGMGGSLSAAAISILEINEGEVRRLRLVLGDEDRNVTAQAFVLFGHPATGLDHRGFYAKGREEGGAFEVEMRGHLDDGRQNLNIKQSVDGRVAAEIDNGVQFARRLHDARAFAVAPTIGLIPEAAWNPILESTNREPDEGDAEKAVIADLVHALAVLQTRVTFPIRVPKLTEYPLRDAREIIGLARLVGGGVVALHDQPLWLCGRDVERPPEDRFAYRIEQQMIFRWEGREADLGTMYIVGWNLMAESGDAKGMRITTISESFLPTAPSGLLRSIPMPSRRPRQDSLRAKTRRRTRPAADSHQGPRRATEDGSGAEASMSPARLCRGMEDSDARQAKHACAAYVGPRVRACP